MKPTEDEVRAVVIEVIPDAKVRFEPGAADTLCFVETTVAGRSHGIAFAFGGALPITLELIREQAREAYQRAVQRAQPGARDS